MNVYQKLQACRVALQSAKIKQSGKNKHAGYTYYELSDFLPTVNKLFADHKLFSHVTFNTEVATLTVINAEKPEERVVFTSPMAEAALKGVQPIQNLGAVQTYQRRYLYLMALEISEGDALDAMHDPNDTPKQTRQNGQRAPQNGVTQNGSASNGAPNDDAVTSALRQYHAVLTPLMAGEEDRKDILRLTYAKKHGLALPESTRDIPVEEIRKITTSLRQLPADRLEAGLRSMRQEYEIPDTVPDAQQEKAPF